MNPSRQLNGLFGALKGNTKPIVKFFLGHYLSHQGNILRKQSKIDVGNISPCILAELANIHPNRKKHKESKSLTPPFLQILP